MRSSLAHIILGVSKFGYFVKIYTTKTKIDRFVTIKTETYNLQDCFLPETFFFCLLTRIDYMWLIELAPQFHSIQN